MKVICFSGNLGNQVFYCAFKDYLKSKYNEKVYYFVMHNCPKVTVDKYFDLTLPDKNFGVNIISSLVFYGSIILNKLFRINMPQKLVCARGEITEDSVFFSNYIQDKYFYENLDSSWLKVNMPATLSEQYIQYESLIMNSDSIAVHIRRGDYVAAGSSYVDLTSTDYYEKAILLVLKEMPSAKLFFFSDDLGFVRNKFRYNNAFFVDCNRGEDSYLDIKLMSLAKANIMANSTFSYWGAYMGHENKKVIYPKHWFCDWTGRKAPDIMLNDWIGL